MAAQGSRAPFEGNNARSRVRRERTAKDASRRPAERQKAQPQNSYWRLWRRGGSTLLSMTVLAVDARVRGVARLMARVLALEGAVGAGDGHQRLLVEDEVRALGGGRHVHAAVHADGVARAGLDAVAAED